MTARYLLDTHVWLWSILEPKRLAEPITVRIEDGRAELWLSPITVWEIVMLAEGGRIDIGADPVGWIEFALREFPVQDVRIDRTIAAASRTVDVPHEDPADRFLAATAGVLGLTLLTHDAKLLGRSGFASIGPG